ncbi:MAG: zinc metalloprotease HtpX [Actinomycetota bacterium]|nr:zinc metalloprotease HtpX [Actinomycetota bacterium]
MSFVLRRSLPMLGTLVGLLMGVGFLAVATVGAPVWFPVAFAIVVIIAQFAINPWIIEWLVPAVIVGHDAEGYTLDHPVSGIVARRCREAGIPLVKLGIVDDGTPNAFTFGHTPGDARMWLTRGLIERLDEAELDAVVAHEIGHIKHWDFAVMTVAAVIPMALYLLYVMTRSDRDTRVVAIGAYVAYTISQFVVLGLSRAREYAADHWSCRCTGNGDALASALVKIAYGMGRVSAEHKEQAAALVAQGKAGAQAARALDARVRRAQSMRAMGIFEPKAADAMAHAFASGIDPDRAVAAMRWDAVNPWAPVLEKLSSHPLVVNRIKALEQSGLPGAPTRFSVLRTLANDSAAAGQVASARARFAKELTIGLAPYGVAVPLFGFGAFTGSATSIGLALAAAGLLFLVKQQLRFPAGHQPVAEVAGLLERLDAGPMAGIPVEVKGQIIGRGFPGYRLSPDLVVQDASGFVPLAYRQPVPFLAELFGLFRAEKFMGQEVVARGWYRRAPGPMIELQNVVAADGRRARSWTAVARYAASGALLVVGLITALAGLSG